MKKSGCITFPLIYLFVILPYLLLLKLTHFLMWLKYRYLPTKQIKWVLFSSLKRKIFNKEQALKQSFEENNQ